MANVTNGLRPLSILLSVSDYIVSNAVIAGLLAVAAESAKMPLEDISRLPSVRHRNEGGSDLLRLTADKSLPFS